MWKWRRTPSVWRSTNCNYCRWVLKTVSPLFIYLFFLVLNVLFLTFGVLNYALAYASSWTFIQHINKCLSVDTANELDDLISGEESQSYWLVPFWFLFVLSVSLTNPCYQDLILPPELVRQFKVRYICLCQVLSKLCRQPIIVYIPEHEVYFLPLNNFDI